MDTLRLFYTDIGPQNPHNLQLPKPKMKLTFVLSLFFLLVVDKVYATKVIVRTVYDFNQENPKCSDDEAHLIEGAMKGVVDSSRRLYYDHAWCYDYCQGFTLGTCYIIWHLCVWNGRNLRSATPRALSPDDVACQTEIEKIDAAMASLNLSASCVEATANPKHTCYNVPDDFE